MLRTPEDFASLYAAVAEERARAAANRAAARAVCVKARLAVAHCRDGSPAVDGNDPAAADLPYLEPA